MTLVGDENVANEDEGMNETVTTHTAMEAKTIDSLNSNNVNLICGERDKMEHSIIIVVHQYR